MLEQTHGNFGNIYGVCKRLLSEHPNNFKLYEVQPLIAGKFNQPIRVYTIMELKINRVYSIYGCLETIIKHRVNVPIFKAKRVTNVGDFPLFSERPNAFDRIKFSSFIYLDNLEIMNIYRQDYNTIVTLRRETADNKYLNLIEIACMSTPESKEVIDSLTVGQEINIIGTIHRDVKYDCNAVNYEVGIKIFKVNIGDNEIESLKKNVEILHRIYKQKYSFEYILKCNQNKDNDK